MGLGFYCDSSVDSFYYVIVMCTVVGNILSFKHVHFEYDQYIFSVCALLLLYVLYYYCMCYIITVCAILLLYVLFELWWISSIICGECMCLDRPFLSCARLA